MSTIDRWLASLKMMTVQDIPFRPALRGGPSPSAGSAGVPPSPDRTKGLLARSG